ncbi:MAG: SDR family oxidoreductase [Leptospiraceae bacterium]|nr:SDR family oxidoreductase [Leptospiraceae bacterium]MCB1317137.1 SDR family oxidoreductase [Leptospiraceae bacterium]
MSTVLITGANRGIGLELTRQLQKRGDQVIGVCRQTSSALAATGARVIEGIEVGSDDSVRGLSSALGDTRIDVLINNAGILRREGLDQLDFQSIREQFEINSLGPLRVTAALLAHLKQGSKVIIITSRMGSIADNTSGGYYGYRMSKAAVNMAGVSLAHDLKGRGISVGILHPGMVATEMTGKNGIPPEESAQGLIARIDALNEARSGHFYHQNGEELPW